MDKHFNILSNRCIKGGEFKERVKYLFKHKKIEKRFNNNEKK